MRKFWNAGRKAQLLKQSKTMTVNQMARYHLQPAVEIERMLKMLDPENCAIVRIYKEYGNNVTVYVARYADGAIRQMWHSM